MLKILDTDAALGHARETELAHRFIRYDSDGIRQIQAARLFDHRYAEAAFRIGFQEVFRKAFRFLPEYEHIIVLELDIGITLFRFRRQIKKAMILVFVQDFLKILMDLDIDERPVIETGPF